MNHVHKMKTIGGKSRCCPQRGQVAALHKLGLLSSSIHKEWHPRNGATVGFPQIRSLLTPAGLPTLRIAHPHPAPHHRDLCLLSAHAPTMPWLDLVSRSDWCSIWYISNGPTGQTSSFDGAKPTVLLMHPDYLDTTWLRAQLDDARLSEGYNLVAMDTRCHGRTKSTPSGRHDIWVEAADVAFFCHVSRAIIHSTRFAPSGYFGRVSLRKAFGAAAAPSTHACLCRRRGSDVLCTTFYIPVSLCSTGFIVPSPHSYFLIRFPEMVLSLTLCQIPPLEHYASARRFSACTTNLATRIAWSRDRQTELVEAWCVATDLATIEDIGVRAPLA